MSHLRRSLLSAAIAAAAIHPPSASAQPAPSVSTAPSTQPDPYSVLASEDAGRTFQLGREAFKADQLDRALALFQQSYALEATPGTLLNIALTEEKLGKAAAALSRLPARGRAAQARRRPPADREEGVARTTPRAPHLVNPAGRGRAAHARRSPSTVSRSPLNLVGTACRSIPARTW